MEKKFCTLKEAENIFGISWRKLRTLAEAGAIPATRVEGGRIWLLDIEEMTNLLRHKVA